jgi:hypothetical protein
MPHICFTAAKVKIHQIKYCKRRNIRLNAKCRRIKIDLLRDFAAGVYQSL